MKSEAVNTAKKTISQPGCRTKPRSVLLFLGLIFFSAMNVQAQGFHIGVKAGANIVRMDGQSFDQNFHFGYNVGAFAEMNFTSKWGIQPEVTWNQANYRTGDHFGDIFPGSPNDVKGKLNYLTIPILLSFRPVKFISLQAGPQFGILMSGDQNLVQNGQNAFKKGDFSLVGGAQLNLAGLKIGARYVLGLTDVDNLGNGTVQDTWKNKGYQVYAGFRIF